MDLGKLLKFLKPEVAPNGPSHATEPRKLQAYEGHVTTNGP